MGGLMLLLKRIHFAFLFRRLLDRGIADDGNAPGPKIGMNKVQRMLCMYVSTNVEVSKRTCE
jgi:hypothetical protein